MYKKSDCFFFSPIVSIVRIFKFSYQMGMWKYFITIGICIFLVTTNAELLSWAYYLLVNLLLSSIYSNTFAHFLIQLLVFLKLGHKCTLIHIDTSSFLNKCVKNIFSRSVTCLFIFFIVSLESKFFELIFVKSMARHQIRCTLNELWDL